MYANGLMHVHKGKQRRTLPAGTDLHVQCGPVNHFLACNTRMTINGALMAS